VTDPARTRLYRLAAARVADLPPAEGLRWLVDHRLPGLLGQVPLPEALEVELRRWAAANTARNLLWVHRFQEVVDLLQGVPVCALKGVRLLESVYAAEPGARMMGDLDLLVPVEAKEETVRRLAGAGFAETPQAPGLGTEWFVTNLRRGDVLVDLHTRLGIKHGAASSWEELEPVEADVHGRRVHVLDEEANLVHLVAHFVKHVPFTRLGWADDVLRWAERGYDAERAAERARRLGAASSLAAGVGALRQVLGPAALPGLPGRRGGLAGLAVRLNGRLVWPHLGADPFAPPGPSRWRHNAAALLLADRPRDAVRYLRWKGREVLARTL
jgi:hypothetical protein